MPVVRVILEKVTVRDIESNTVYDNVTYISRAKGLLTVGYLSRPSDVVRTRIHNWDNILTIEAGDKDISSYIS